MTKSSSLLSVRELYHGMKDSFMKDDDDLPSLKELGDSIEKARKKAEGEEGKKGNSQASAMRISVDLLSGVIVGSFAGYYLDKWLDTKPVFFLICFFLGVAGSVRNIYRDIQRINMDDKE